MSEWYYMFEGRQQGPVTGSQLKSLAATGGLGPDDLVWNQAMTEWAPAKRVRGLVFAGQLAPRPAAMPAAIAAAPMANSTAHPEAQEQAYAPTDSPAPVQAAAALGYAQPIAEGISPRTIELLRQTRPWVLLISILMFIGLGFAALGAIFGLLAVIAGGAAASSALHHPAPMIAGAAGAVVMFIFVAAYAALLFFPAMYLMRYASAIKRLTVTHRIVDLEAAVSAQKSYWKFIGVLIVIGIGFYVLAMLLAVIGALMH